MRTIRRAAWRLSGLAAALLLSGCGREGPAEPARYQTAFLGSLDTVVRFTAYCGDSAAFDRACELVRAELERADRLYNLYRPDSELFRVNEGAGQGPAAVEPALADAVEASLAWQETTPAVNIAMGSVLSLWHTAREEGSPPDGAAIREAMGHASPSAVRVTRDGGRAWVELADPAMSLDLGSTAKGLAAQEIAEKLRQNGFGCFLLDCGTSTLVCAGSPPGRDGWTVAVRNPDASLNRSGAEDPPETLGQLTLRDGCVGTSGDYQKYFVQNGVLYPHILDAATGQPAAYVRAVTVIAPDAGAADFYSTALYAQPYEQARELAEGIPGLEALWVFADGSTAATPGFGLQPEA